MDGKPLSVNCPRCETTNDVRFPAENERVEAVCACGYTVPVVRKHGRLSFLWWPEHEPLEDKADREEPAGAVPADSGDEDAD
jgi:hypothetical protein